MGVQGPDMKPGGSFVGVVDPHRHIDNVDFPQSPRFHPFFGAQGCRGEAVVEVNPIAQVLFLGQGNHFLRQGNIVRDRLFTQYRNTAFNNSMVGV